MRYSMMTRSKKGVFLDSKSANNILEARRLAIQANKEKRYAFIAYKDSLISLYQNEKERDVIDEIIMEESA